MTANDTTGLPSSVAEATETLEQTLVSTVADVSLPTALLQQTDDAKVGPLVILILQNAYSWW